MKALFYLLTLGLAWPTFAQQLDIKQATLGAWMDFRPEAFFQMQWRDPNRLTAWKDGVLWQATPNQAPDTLLTAKLLNALVGTKFKSLPPTYWWVSPDELLFEIGLDYVFVDFSQRKLPYTHRLPEKAENASLHPPTGKVAFTLGPDVFVQSPDGSAIQLTEESRPGVSHGSGYVHRQEFGIDRGIWWSPNGKRLAWYTKDESMVTDYPLVETGHRIATMRSTKYPMAGMTSEEVVVTVHDFSSKTNTSLLTGNPADQYLTAVTWGPDNATMFLGILNRGQDSLSMQVYDAQSGQRLRVLFTETHGTWVEPEHPLYFLPDSPNQFIWQSERDGWNHLYLYDTQGKMIRQLTQGKYVVTELYGAFGGEVYYQSTEPDPRERHVYAVSLKKDKKRKISAEQGTHEAVIGPDGRWLAQRFESLEHPGLYQIAKSDGTPAQLLLEAKDPFQAAGIKLPALEMVELTAADGSSLYGRIIKPQPLESAQKHPAILYVYGGPHAQLVANRWLGGASLWDYYMAQRGYVMFTLDNRGSAHRGRAFEEQVHRRLGTLESQDQMLGLEWLKSKPFVDATRLGIHGWSFGGFMTTTLMTENPGFFRAGVAGGPVIDWKWYEVMYGERYMDTPQDNPKGYAASSLLTKAAQLQDPLLVIHGYQDDVVVPQHALEFVEACIKSGTQLDFFFYPSHPHNVRGKDRVHLMEKVTRYFDLYLKGLDGKSFR